MKAACSLLLALFTLGSPLFAADPAKPNVLFIAIDDLRDWVGYLGKNPQTKTPNIDRLAARGVAFTRSYCAAPVCNPSRAALMSGLRPFTSGVYENNNDWRDHIAPAKTLVTQFRQAGYFTAGAGKIYHGGFDRTSEWEDYGGGGKGKKREYSKGANAGTDGIRFAPFAGPDDAVEDWDIAGYGIEQLGKKHDRPFFLTIGLHKPHMPWIVPQKYYDMFPLEKIALPPHSESDLADLPPAGLKMARPQADHAAIATAGLWKQAIQAYLAATAYTDMNVGRLLDALDKSAYRDNTIIVFWSDHGWHLGEKQHWRKFALWEEATRSPLLWVAPGVTKPGGRCERTVDFMTIYPTLCDLAGLPIPPHVEGQSIRALLADPGAAWAQPALTTYLFKNHAVRTEGWRYIRYANGDEELYDEAKDPNEWENLASKPEAAARKAELAKYLPANDQPDSARGGARAEKKEKKAAKREKK